MTRSAVDPAFHERLGRALGAEFEVLGLLGRGGFADVYEIRERKLDRSLAIKVLRPEITLGPVMVSRFEREARALASLNHLNIPPIHFVGENEGLLYYVMPLIAGESVGDRLLTRGPLPPGEVVDIMIPILEALHHAHHLGIVHRDIKPDNIIIEEETGRPLLVDFGVARQNRTDPCGGGLPGGVGTPGYLSPEQIAGPHEVDARSDIYSAGATMYHLITGTMPQDGRSPDALIPTIPEWLSAVVMRALAAEPGDRFRSAGEMAEALRAGRRSSSLEVPSLRKRVRQIREEDTTPPMVAAVKDRTSQPWDQRSGPRRRPATRSSRSVWPVYLGVVAAVAGYFLLVPVKLSLRNNLLVPVELSTESGKVWTMPPGGELFMPLSQQGRATGRWFVVNPVLSDSSRARQETVSGMIRIEGLTAAELLLRRVRRSVDSWSDGSVIFAPRVTNASAGPVTVKVLRANSQSFCNCVVAPGETRLLGYFRLESSSAVEITGGRRRSTVFRNLESRMDLNTGLLDLMVNDTILSRSPR